MALLIIVMSDLNHEPLCKKCDKPTVTLELVKPNGRRREESDMLPRPRHNEEVKKRIEATTRNLVSLVCHRNDKARFEHEEWCLSGDGDVVWHTYYLVRDCIYSVVRVELD